jgi:uncharacterized protein (TIGR00661 family)
MAKIFISLSGDGRGHATRMRALVEALREEHEITLFTSGQALEFLGRLYARSTVAVRAIPGLRFCYGAQGELHYPATLLQAARYLLGLSSIVRGLEERILEERPDLAIIDFEPALARAARRRRLPFLLLNHQHFLTDRIVRFCEERARRIPLQLDADRARRSRAGLCRNRARGESRDRIVAARRSARS